MDTTLNKDGFDSEPNAGIEANDLASLLCRFEEATNDSADDLNMLIMKKRRDMLHTTKSAGNSPAVTPGVTPPPYRRNMINCANTTVIQRSLVKPQVRPQVSGSLLNQSVINTTNASSSLPRNRSMPALLVQVQPTAATMSVQMNSGHIYASQNASVHTSASTGFKPYRAVHNQKLIRSKSELPGSEFQQISRTPSVSNITVLVTSGANFSQTKENELKEGPSVAIPRPSLSASSHSLLQSVLNPIVQQRNTSMKSMGKAETVVKSVTELFHTSDSVESKTAASSQQTQHQVTLNDVNFQDQEVNNKVDHSYCFLQEQKRGQSELTGTEHLITLPDGVDSAQSKGESNEQATVAKSSVPVPDLLKDNIGDSIKSFNISDHESCSLHAPATGVFEEGEVQIDADGNDCFPQQICQVVNTPVDDKNRRCRHSTSSGSPDKNSRLVRKRSYRNRQRAEFSTSPIREDTSSFYDKIPSYYTALSIPSKPMKTTAFASASRTIGSTDHLDYLDSSEPADEGHYDKVPAHRRCFTNTTKEVEMEEPITHYFTNKNMNASVQFCDPPSSSRTEQVNSEYTDMEFQNADGPHSPRPSTSQRRSRSTSRHSRASSRRSARSGSSMSDCSTCSSRSSSSGCSTCSFSSRSRSRSQSPMSSDNEEQWRHRDYRRSRSHSPAWSRERRFHGRRDRRRGSSPRYRSRSPIRKHESWGMESRSGSHRSRHHSAADKQALERRKAREQERLKAMEERRVVYVGKIPNDYTKKQLYQRFECFGQIKEVKVNFRERGDNYGFVTFAYACDAIAAKEKGNNVSNGPKFDLCFGGRRQFCPDQYADLDGNREIEEEYAPMPKNLTEELDYAALLKQHSSRQKKAVFY